MSVEDKLDKVLEKLNNIELHVAKNTKDVEYHIRRTDIAEEQQAKNSKKIQYIIYLLILGAGAQIAEWSPAFVAILKGLL